MNEIKTFAQGDTEYLLCLLLRYKILRIPLGMTFKAEHLAKDKHDFHFGLFQDGVALACLILNPSEEEPKVIRLRAMAVDTLEQGKGLGKQLAQYAEEYAKEHGYQTIYCFARETAVPFYKKLGYNIEGTIFQEVGLPHYKMTKTL